VGGGSIQDHFGNPLSWENRTSILGYFQDSGSVVFCSS
jgi:hypothetical protein